MKQLFTKMQNIVNKHVKHYKEDFDEIRARLLDGKHPLGYYYAEGIDAYPLGFSKDSLVLKKIDTERSFGVYVDGDEIKLPIKCSENDTFSVCFEFSLFHPESVVTYSPTACLAEHAETSTLYAPGLHLGPCVLSHQSVWGDGIVDELSKYRVESNFKDGVANHLLSVKIPEGKWNGKTAIRLMIKIGDHSWKSDPDPVRTLGKYDLSADDFGFLLPLGK
jgi:hypothetical protein